MPRARSWDLFWASEVTLGFLAITLLGLKFSGTLAAVAVAIVVVVAGVIWYLATQRR